MSYEITLKTWKKNLVWFPKADGVIPPQGCLLLYGTYLAGLTSNVSHPPVNQSPTILTVVTLVTISSTVALPVSVFLQAWPNVVYSIVAGAIFICTLATNCMLFVPQVRNRLPQSTIQSFKTSLQTQENAMIFSVETLYLLEEAGLVMRQHIIEPRANMHKNQNL